MNTTIVISENELKKKKRHPWIMSLSKPTILFD